MFTFRAQIHKAKIASKLKLNCTQASLYVLLLVYKQNGTVQILYAEFLVFTCTGKSLPNAINNLLHLWVTLLFG